MLHTTCPEPDTILPPLKDSIKRNRPAGTEAWVRRMARQLDLEYSLRPHGRPPGWRKTEEGEIMEATKAERQQGSEQYKCPRPLYFDRVPFISIGRVPLERMGQRYPR